MTVPRLWRLHVITYELKALLVFTGTERRQGGGKIIMILTTRYGMNDFSIVPGGGGVMQFVN